MKAKKFVLKEIDLELKEATLLSFEQFKKAKPYLRAFEFPLRDEGLRPYPFNDFWLKDQVNNGVLSTDYTDFKYTPHYEKSQPEWFCDGKWGYEIYFEKAIRPIVVFSNSNGELSPGDRFQIEDTDFTVIGDNIAIVDHAIGVSEFDKESADYEKSEIKKKVDDWFKKLVKESH
ncbi:MAG: hypothetical protein J5852_01235 [Clostridia bacterium]|nr:hypothetical protein [Clostridia bacterium]